MIFLRPIARVSVLSVLFALTSAVSVRAECPTVEIIQSIPEETNLAQPDLAFARDAWIEMFRGATTSIDIGQMYFANEKDSPLEEVLVELERAARRGVKVRVLLSKNMVDDDLPTYLRLLEIPDAEVRQYDLSKLTGGIIHAKYFIVDGKLSFVGSQNFDWRALTQIHETGVRICDRKIAEGLTRIFEIDWEIAETGSLPAILPSTESPAEGAIELVASPAELNPDGVRASLPALLELFASAKSSIRFQVMTYSIGKPGREWTEIDNALRAAAGRGVRVEMMTSNWNTGRPDIDGIKSLALVPGIEVKIVSFPEASRGFIPYARVTHTKQLIVDDSIYWLGTSNWTRSYFYQTRGVELIFRDRSLAEIGLRIFDRLWSSEYASPVEQDRVYVPPRRN